MTANSGHSIRVTLVTREARPLELFGADASATVAAALEAAGIEFIGGQTATVSGGTVLLPRHPLGSLSVDRIVALPLVRGLRLPGVPTTGLFGLIGVDGYGRVKGLTDVYAAGDATDYPVKQGDIACQQADAVATCHRGAPRGHGAGFALPAGPACDAAHGHRSVDPARPRRRCGRTREAARPLPRAVPAPGADRGLSEPLRAAVDLCWIPLGAGGHSVRLNGQVFEAIQAAREHRRRCELYHAAIVVELDLDRYTIEVAPSPDADEASRGVVGTGAVGSRHLGVLRLFRYEVRRWRNGSIPDLAAAVGKPRRLTTDPEVARRAPRPRRAGSETSVGPRRTAGRRDVELQLPRSLADRSGRPGGRYAAPTIGRPRSGVERGTRRGAAHAQAQRTSARHSRLIVAGRAALAAGCGRVTADRTLPAGDPMREGAFLSSVGDDDHARRRVQQLDRPFGGAVDLDSRLCGEPAVRCRCRVRRTGHSSARRRPPRGRSAPALPRPRRPARRAAATRRSAPGSWVTRSAARPRSGSGFPRCGCERSAPRGRRCSRRRPADP